MTQLINQYNNPENFDSLASTDYKVSMAQRKVENQIIEALKNTQQLQETDEKAQRLVLESENYDQTTNDFKNTMSLRNTKVQIILGIIVAAIVIAILITIFK